MLWGMKRSRKGKGGRLLRARQGSSYLQRGLRVRVQAVAAALGVDTLPALPEHYVNLHIHQQGDNEGHVEGDDGGIHDKGRIGNDALILVWKTKGFRLVVTAARSWHWLPPLLSLFPKHRVPRK